MIQRIRFGTAEQVKADLNWSKPATAEPLDPADQAIIGKYMLHFTGYMSQVPGHSDFPLAMSTTGLRWRYAGQDQLFKVGDTQQEADEVTLLNGESVARTHNGKIFQLAHNILYIARQVPIGGAEEMIEFRDLSGALPKGGNAFHA